MVFPRRTDGEHQAEASMVAGPARCSRISHLPPLTIRDIDPYYRSDTQRSPIYHLIHPEPVMHEQLAKARRRHAAYIAHAHIHTRHFIGPDIDPSTICPGNHCATRRNRIQRPPPRGGMTSGHPARSVAGVLLRSLISRSPCRTWASITQVVQDASQPRAIRQSGTGVLRSERFLNTRDIVTNQTWYDSTCGPRRKCHNIVGLLDPGLLFLGGNSVFAGCGLTVQSSSDFTTTPLCVQYQTH
ncbi:hypothetical protein BS50DRAFT_80002 [Corynespora cassiicola Philippines]|uniref:Uncharacterized protein n=1 Tax=Corynespora cassiicola Philippines TaxID=1448308 RepID=A0A2T2NH54_CORCC|nr:hypothetical protein BS50DRAFT_80002 [Corynespora cassiicola Philippines]